MKRLLYEKIFVIFKVFYLIVTVTILYNMSIAVQKWYIQHRTIQENERKLLDKEEEIGKISREIEKLKDPLYIERISREKLDMSRDRDKIYKLRRNKKCLEK